ncbi:hypothetical protein [Caballeronia fortuita]|nr:hypothetical protein [Caballeronia fortuita]
MASASALGIGVLGTVAYGMWFNHDQRVYAEAMASARRTLGIDQPAIAAQTQSGGVVETPLSAVSGAPAGTVPYPSIESASLADNAPVADATDETVVADGSGAAAAGTAALATTAAQPQTQLAVQRRGSPSATQRAAVDRGNRADRADQYAQSRRHQSQQTRAKPDSGLFARVGAFFHRVSYRHNVPTRQREEYSRP